MVWAKHRSAKAAVSYIEEMRPGGAHHVIEGLRLNPFAVHDHMYEGIILPFGIIFWLQVYIAIIEVLLKGSFGVT